MARRFKEARKLRRMTAVAAAKEMKISNPTITYWVVRSLCLLIPARSFLPI